MLKLFISVIAATLLFFACESVYTPELDEVEDLLVVDARLVYGKQENEIILQKTKGFNDIDNYNPVENATVVLADEAGVEYHTIQNRPGIYTLGEQLDSLKKYKLVVIVEGETYSSGVEEVPPLPEIDTIYSDHEEQWVQPGGETSTGNFIKLTGQQIFVNIAHKSLGNYYRFTARKILQYYFPFDTVMFGISMTEYKYAWKSLYSQESFNLAGPAEYSLNRDIIKHPLEFFRYNVESLLDTTENGLGWIYIIHQYGISNAAFNFYKDLNSQLNADGKIFDPLYVQARNNLECISTPGKIVLGNFEIASYREHRYYVRLNKYSGKHTIRPIEVFHDIPPSGVKPLSVPWFWEH
jgi:hypothetical protein